MQSQPRFQAAARQPSYIGMSKALKKWLESPLLSKDETTELLTELKNARIRQKYIAPWMSFMICFSFRSREKTSIHILKLRRQTDKCLRKVYERDKDFERIRILSDMNHYADLGGCYPTRPITPSSTCITLHISMLSLIQVLLMT